jgi:hypothetical protein
MMTAASVVSVSVWFKSALNMLLSVILLLESVQQIVAFQPGGSIYTLSQHQQQLSSGVHSPGISRSSSSLSMSDRVPYVPYYPSKSSKDYQWMDIYNALGRDRTLFIGRYLDDEACNQLIASLIWYVTSTVLLWIHLSWHN